jgi:bifunctional NMN adenylyltransferase/nudix hydrolase
MNKSWNACVLITHGQPITNGTMEAIKTGFQYADTLIVVLGGLDKPRSFRDPFTFEERKKMLVDSAVNLMAWDTNLKIQVVGVHDDLYHHTKWVKSVELAVLNEIHVAKLGSKARIGWLLPETNKENETSISENDFPHWDIIHYPLVGLEDAANGTTGTRIREAYFSNIGHLWVKNCDGHKDGDGVRDGFVPPAVADFLRKFINTPDYKYIMSWHDKLMSDRIAWAQTSPYKMPGVAGDMCVRHSGHILYVRRKFHPGKGLWALPGGFIDPPETTLRAALRELEEETGLVIDPSQARHNFLNKEVFDAPFRSSRGQVISHAFFVDITDSYGSLPEVKAKDDAQEVAWIMGIPERHEMFEDHFEMVSILTGLAPQKELR